MPTYTSFLNLYLPNRVDAIAVDESLSDNFTKIDDGIKKADDKFVRVKDYGAVGDGITDDTTAIQNAINYADTNKMGVLFDTREYLVSQLTFKKGRYFMNGAKLKAKNILTGNVYVVDVEADSVVDNLHLIVPSANMAERFIRINAGCKIDSIDLIASAQQATLNDNLDAGVYVTGAKVSIGRIKVSKVDYGVILYNVTDSFIGSISVDTFIRGAYVRQCKDVHFGSIVTYTSSPNAGQNPGNNGLLVEGSQQLNFHNVEINDSGEHGIRVGGYSSSPYPQNKLHFGEVVTRRTGQCGFKAMTGSTDLITYLSISSLHAYDCAYQNTAGTNEDGLYLVNCRHVNVGQVFVDAETTFISSYNGVYMSGCQYVNIGNVSVREASNVGIMIDQVNGDGEVNEIFIDNATIRKVGAEGIYINHGAGILRDIIVRGIYIREYGVSSYAVRVIANSTTVGVNQPVLFQGYVERGSSTGLLLTNTSDVDLRNYLTEV